MLSIKILGLIGAFLFAAPVAAVAAPANGLTAHNLAAVASAPQSVSGAAVAPGDTTAKIDKVWWRGGWGWRGRGFAFRGGPGWRYGWRGPGWGYYRPYAGYYAWGRPYWRGRWVY